MGTGHADGQLPGHYPLSADAEWSIMSTKRLPSKPLSDKDGRLVRRARNRAATLAFLCGLIPAALTLFALSMDWGTRNLELLLVLPFAFPCVIAIRSATLLHKDLQNGEVWIVRGFTQVTGQGAKYGPNYRVAGVPVSIRGLDRSRRKGPILDGTLAEVQLLPRSWTSLRVIAIGVDPTD